MKSQPPRGERGFTLVEVLVAALVLVTGMLGVLTLTIEAQSATFSNQARTGGTALVREVTEGVRAVPYDQLVTGPLAARLQAQTNLGDDSPTVPGWQIHRGALDYTVSVGVCATDDPRDGYGNHPAGQFCASGTTGTTSAQCAQLLQLGVGAGLPGAGVTAAAAVGLGDCGLDVDLDGAVDGLVDLAGTLCVGTCALGGVDTSPADAKRVVVLVRWDRGKGSRYVLQAATIANPGLAGAPAITALTATPSGAVTSAATTSVVLSAATSNPAATVAAYLDGTQVGAATGTGSAWSFTWPLGTVSSGSTPGANEVVDGSYLVGLKAYDDNGQFGQSRALTVLVNRRAPYAPRALRTGRNGMGVELEWQPGTERDIVTYRGYRSTGSGWVLVCETVATTCRDENAPGGMPSYTVLAVDRDAAGDLREGAMATTSTVPLLNTPPVAPTNLVATSASGTTVLTWSAASPGDHDLGDSVDHYTIYRDGQAYQNRYE
ncbi:MAG: prepilin-type N-terminal cleavage/methylation protein, partial [Solirubrobacterales bacterium]|nr:prepilin-type N-terminal cleavage/methylation protein [Solirubrobacterales bacterium]